MDKNFKKTVVVVLLLLGLFTFGLTGSLSIVRAEDDGHIDTESPLPISERGEDLVKWSDQLDLESLMEGRVTTAINFFIFFSALVAVALVVASGYMFITSAGDPEKVQKAQKALTAAIVGMIIVFVARLIVGFFIDFGTGVLPL